jgi:molecular chaperone DnaK
MQRPLYVGIDLGTTNSAAAVFDGVSVSPVRTALGGVLTPSVVRVDARGNTTVGQKAWRSLGSDPANTRSGFKRLMGTAHRLAFPASGLHKTPEELSAEVLISLRNDVREQCGVLPELAVISVPALFELPQSAATSDAARRAGFKRVELIQEPVASALAAGWSSEQGRGAWLVYDLGGGTFDVSLLETKEGLLHVVGHDGDNFLGGRDLDRALVDLVLARLAQQGTPIDRANPGHALALRRLEFAAEEAKIELTRSREATLYLADLDLPEQRSALDMVVTRDEYEACAVPLIDRSLQICARLLAAHGLAHGGLARVVLVGGPTVTPCLRQRVVAQLDAVLVEGLDPMTLVATGAALFAGSVGLDARPVASQTAKPEGVAVWLQYPTLTGDLSPFLVGKLVAKGSAVRAVRVRRADGGWQSSPEPVDAEHTFAIMLQLLPRTTSQFELEGLLANDDVVALSPRALSICHGIALGDPPLARSVGVALANDRVQVYFERGSPLPIRRTFRLHTVQSAGPESLGPALRVPIVQGEFQRAHLCRLVGTLEIANSALPRPLPAGTELEIMIELDRGGQLHATARVDGLDVIFEHVALLVTPVLAEGELDNALASLRERSRALTRTLNAGGIARGVARLSAADAYLAELARDLSALAGGDLDAGEKARRQIVEFDAILAELEDEQAWPELKQRLHESYSVAASWVDSFGTRDERAMLSDALAACNQALLAKNSMRAESQLAIIERLGSVAFGRHPDALRRQFEFYASRVTECTDLRRATALLDEGRQALRSADRVTLEGVVTALGGLLPPKLQDRLSAFGSGLRSR